MNKKIVIVGGGAGGFELAVKLGKKYRKNDTIDIVLIDQNPTHVWKPLLHEIATGSLNSDRDEISYLMVARKYQFSFVLGTVVHADSQSNTLTMSAMTEPDGTVLVTKRTINYSNLVLCVGSVSNDFGTPGVAKNCFLMDTRAEAERFHHQFVNHLHKLNARKSQLDDDNSRLTVAIVGGGATGVELAADLHNVAAQLPEYGFSEYFRENLQVIVIEAGPSILGQLPNRISASVTEELTKIGVEVRANTVVSEVTATNLVTKDKQDISADLIVWAAGIRAPSFLVDSDLPTDRLGRVEVNQNLTVKGYSHIFSIGDCCACPMGEDEYVPPRAQSAHQMATCAYRNIVATVSGKDLEDFRYKDFGSLISLGEFSTIGNLMGNLMSGTVFVEGWLARMFYLSLYRMHQASIYGYVATGLRMIADALYRATHSKIKLH